MLPPCWRDRTNCPDVLSLGRLARHEAKLGSGGIWAEIGAVNGAPFAVYQDGISAIPKFPSQGEEETQ